MKFLLFIQVDPYAKDPKELEIYNIMVSLLDAEKACHDRIRDSEEEVRRVNFKSLLESK